MKMSPRSLSGSGIDVNNVCQVEVGLVKFPARNICCLIKIMNTLFICK